MITSGTDRHMSSSEAEAAKHISEWLPAVGDSFDERVELFRANALDLRAEFHLLDNVNKWRRIFARLRLHRAGKRVASHSGELTDRACAALALPQLAPIGVRCQRTRDRCDAGHQRMRRAYRADWQRAGVEQKRRRTSAFGASPSPCRSRAARATPCGLAGGVRSLEKKIRLRLSKFHLIYNRAKPNRRHRANPRPRCTRTKETDHPLRLIFPADCIAAMPSPAARARALRRFHIAEPLRARSLTSLRQRPLYQFMPFPILARRNSEHRMKAPRKVVAIVIANFIGDGSYVLLVAPQHCRGACQSQRPQIGDRRGRRWRLETRG